MNEPNNNTNSRKKINNNDKKQTRNHIILRIYIDIVICGYF